MDEKTLRKVQLTQKEILDEIVRICNENNLRYYLDYGTLLGAVRNKGFIPWDDDLDISMPREDYDIFNKIAKDKLSDKYFLLNWDNNENYGMSFAKIMKKDTKYIELISNGIVPNGIFVDIFPLDFVSENKKIEKKYASKIYLYKRLYILKNNYKYNFIGLKGIIYKLLAIYANCFSKVKLKYKLEKYLKLIGNNEKKLVAVISESSAKNNISNKMKSSQYSDNNIIFENTSYTCVNDTDMYLKSLYGDYMKLPPVEQRNNYHSVIEIDFGKIK